MSGLLDSITAGLVPQNIGIEEFAESSSYCSKALFPRQTALLKLIFLEEMTGPEEDILQSWIDSSQTGGEVLLSPNIRERRDYLRERGYKHFREIQLVGGRRSSKGFVTGLAMAKVMWDCLQLGDPHERYGIDPGKEIYFSCVAASESQAKEFQFGDFVSTVETCKAFEPYLQKSLETEFRVATSSDLRKISAAKARGNKIQRDIAKLRGKALAANAGTLRGSATMSIAQPMDAKILTPSGWVTMNDLRVGSEITGSDGLSQTVRKIWPRGVQDAYRVTFSDGSSTVCGGDHLWTLHQKRVTDKPKTKSILEFADDLTKCNGKNQPLEFKWALPQAPLVQFSSGELPLSPYLIGALIGDGSFSTRSSVVFYNTDKDILGEVTRELPPGYELLSNGGTIGFRIVKESRASGPQQPNQVRSVLNHLGLAGKIAVDKFIPECYLRGKENQRLALLQGLLDTDGTVHKNDGSIKFGTVSERLALDVVELVRSLGGYATIYSSGKVPDPCMIDGQVVTARYPIYEVCISDMRQHQVVRAKRKLINQRPYDRYTRRRRRLMSVEAIAPVAMQCITVSNSDGLYVTDDLIVTHNCIDEMAHMIPGESKASAEQVYSAAIPSLNQFGLDSLIFCNSSPYTKVGKFYEIFDIAMRPFNPHGSISMGQASAEEHSDPRLFSIEFPSWELFRGYMKHKSRWKQRTRGRELGKMPTASPDWDPDEVDAEGDDLYSEEDKQFIISQRVEEAKNPETFKVEQRSQFAEVIDAFLNPAMVDQMYAGIPAGVEPMPDGTFKKLFTPFYTNFGQGALNTFRYKFHLDPSSTTAGFGFAIAHIESFVNPNSGEPEEHAVFDMIKRWDPKAFGGVIRWKPILEEVLMLADIFRPYEITMDQHQSMEPIQTLQEMLSKRNIVCRVYMQTATNELNWKRWQVLKTAIYQGLVHAPMDEGQWSDPTCQNELKFLQEMPTGGKFPKVEKQDIGPVRTKDQADCVAEAVHSLIGNLMATRMRERLSTGGSFGSPGGFGIGQGGPMGGNGPPGINEYYSSREQKVMNGRMDRGHAPMDRSSLTRSALGGRGRYQGSRSRGR